MATPITAYQAADGSLYLTAQAAEAHDARTRAREALVRFLRQYDLDDLEGLPVLAARSAIRQAHCLDLTEALGLPHEGTVAEVRSWDQLLGHVRSLVAEIAGLRDEAEAEDAANEQAELAQVGIDDLHREIDRLRVILRSAEPRAAEAEDRARAAEESQRIVERWAETVRDERDALRAQVAARGAAWGRLVVAAWEVVEAAEEDVPSDEVDHGYPGPTPEQVEEAGRAADAATAAPGSAGRKPIVDEIARRQEEEGLLPFPRAVEPYPAEVCDVPKGSIVYVPGDDFAVRWSCGGHRWVGRAFREDAPRPYGEWGYLAPEGVRVWVVAEGLSDGELREWIVRSRA